MRATHALWLDDVRPGMRLDLPAFDCSAELVAGYADLLHARHPIHVDAEYAKTTRYGRLIAHGPLIIAKLLAMLGGVFGDALQVLLGVGGWRFLRARVRRRPRRRRVHGARCERRQGRQRRCSGTGVPRACCRRLARAARHCQRARCPRAVCQPGLNHLCFFASNEQHQPPHRRQQRRSRCLPRHGPQVRRARDQTALAAGRP